MIPVTWALGIGLVVASSGATFYVSSLYYKEQLQKQKDSYQVKIDIANIAANQAAFRYEEWKSKQETTNNAVNKEVEHAIESNPNWSNTKLPVGLCESLSNLYTDINTSESDNTLPRISCTEDKHK